MKQARGMRNNNPLNIVKSDLRRTRTLPSLKPWSMDCGQRLSCSAPTTKNMGAGRFGKSWRDGTPRDQR